jgi:hypothetical protein
MRIAWMMQEGPNRTFSSDAFGFPPGERNVESLRERRRVLQEQGGLDALAAWSQIPESSWTSDADGLEVMFDG